MIVRRLSNTLAQLARLYPTLTVTGPRQAGKTTLIKAAFPQHTYVNLEGRAARDFATADPAGFLAQHRAGAIFDEVQNTPGLLNELLVEVDEDPTPGRFVLSGSQHFGLLESVSQSLAGRTAVTHLLPPSWEELQQFDAPPTSLFEALFVGAYPRIFDRHIPPSRWLADYISTYVERDLRQLINVKNLNTFRTFLRLCAGRTGQELNFSALGADAGITHHTAREWMSMLETSFICFQVPAWHRNVRKRQVKTAKLHFFDTGLVCHLLGITMPEQLRTHPLRGAIFETWVASEVYKARAHAGLTAHLHHLRQTQGVEMDLIVEHAGRVTLVESKSSSTTQSAWLEPMRRVRDSIVAANGPPTDLALVYGGDATQRRTDGTMVAWRDLGRMDWSDGAPGL